MSLAQDRIPEFEKAMSHFQQELGAIRTGRANPAMVEQIIVDAYGTPTPLLQLASITTPEATQLLIQPWDPNVVKSIEKALQASSLGITPTVDATGIRLNFPPLTEERRKELIKTVREKAEQARVAIRAVREDVNKQMKRDEKAGDLSEDLVRQEEKTLQSLVDTYTEKVNTFVTKKEAELSEI